MLVFNKKTKVCELVSDVYSVMVIKMEEPLVTMKAPPPGWILGNAESDDPATCIMFNNPSRRSATIYRPAGTSPGA